MFVRFLCDWPPYRDGQAIELFDDVAGAFLSRGIAEACSAAEVREAEAVDLGIDVEAIKADVFAEQIKRDVEQIKRDVLAEPAPASAKAPRGKRTVTEDQWRAEIGADQSGYATRWDKHYEAVRAGALTF